MIRLTRGDYYVDKFRAYKILIDDVYYGDIRKNEMKEFIVDNGNHVIYAKIDWCRSNKLNFESDGSVLELEVGSSLSGGKLFIPFVTLIYSTLLKNKCLWIRKKLTNV